MSLGLSLLIYLGVGIPGFLLYGVSTKDNILLNFPKDESLTVIMSGIMAFVVAICFPINVYPLRSLLAQILFPGETEIQMRYFHILTICVIVVSFAISALVPHMGDIFDFTGASGCLFVCYLLPCAYLMKLQGESIMSLMVVAAIGTICSVLSLYQLVVSKVHG